MRLLLDTHIALWALVGDPRLPERADKLIANPNNAVFVSAASVWEISIKHALARSPDGYADLRPRRASILPGLWL
jgi:PIN domain nuclease of toxin-antitoxin system